MSDVYWCSLPERNGAANDQCYNALLAVAFRCGQRGFQPIQIGYSRTDFARNEISRKFMELSRRDDDLLVMLDADHKHPENIVERFANNDPGLGVVGALAYRRGEPYDPLFFVRTDEGKGGLYPLAKFERGLIYECAIVSTSAIAIRRWVFLDLERRGYSWPWFRYEYPTNNSLPSEDMYFGWVCERAGIKHHCDTGLVIPHASIGWVDNSTFEKHLADHPEMIGGDLSAGVANG